MNYKPKILILSPYAPRQRKDWVEPLGSLYIATHMHNLGYQAKMLNPLSLNNDENKLMEVMKDFEVIGISAYTCNANSCATLLNNFKNKYPEKLTVVGGHHITNETASNYVAVNQGIDAVIIGYGEIPFAKLVSDWFNERNNLINIPNIVFRHPESGKIYKNEKSYFEAPIKTTPNRKLELFNHNLEIEGQYGDISQEAVVVFSFGCSNSCHYCSIKQKIRFREIDQTADEIEELYHQGKKIIWFADINHFVIPQKVKQLNDELKKRKVIIKKHALLDPSITIKNPDEILKIIEEGNYIGLFFGRDVATNSEAKMYGRTLGCDIRDVEKEKKYFFIFIEKCIKRGIQPIVSYMFAHPKNTIEETELKMQEVIFLDSIGARVSIYTHTPFPETRARAELFSKGLIPNENLNAWDKYDLMFWPVYNYLDQRVRSWVVKTGNSFRTLRQSNYRGNAKLMAGLVHLNRSKLNIPPRLKKEINQAQKIINYIN